MPPFRLRPGGRPYRLLAIIVVALLAIGSWRLFLSLGHLLYHADPLESAEAVFVLGGGRIDRVAEAGDLVLEGWAMRVLLSAQLLEGAELALQRRGLNIPTEPELQRAVLTQMGVPGDAIEELPPQPSTSAEGTALAQIARARGWSRVIVVTSKLHTARVALVMRRRFEGSGVRIIVRPTRYDLADVDRWWVRRADLSFVLFESQKLVAYWVGLAD